MTKTLDNTKTDGEKVIPFNSLLIPDYYKKKGLRPALYCFYLLIHAIFFLKKETESRLSAQRVSTGNSLWVEFITSVSIVSWYCFYLSLLRRIYFLSIYDRDLYQAFFSNLSNSIVGTWMPEVWGHQTRNLQQLINKCRESSGLSKSEGGSRAGSLAQVSTSCSNQWSLIFFSWVPRLCFWQ